MQLQPLRSTTLTPDDKAVRSHPGRRRTVNHDRWLAWEGVYAVADGVGGGTAAAVIGNRVAITHLGDSRAYRMRDSRLRRLTGDHSFRAEPQISTVRARPGDLYLLCTDGLTNLVPDERVAQILRAYSRLDRMAERLVECALRAGGRDNVTVVLFRAP